MPLFNHKVKVRKTGAQKLISHLSFFPGDKTTSSIFSFVRSVIPVHENQTKPILEEQIAKVSRKEKSDLRYTQIKLYPYRRINSNEKKNKAKNRIKNGIPRSK